MSDFDEVYFPGTVLDADTVEVRIPMMGLRDYFAGQALLTITKLDPMTPATIAGWCYTIADAMLRERAKEKPDEARKLTCDNGHKFAPHPPVDPDYPSLVGMKCPECGEWTRTPETIAHNEKKLTKERDSLREKLRLATRDYEEHCDMHPDGVITCDECARDSLRTENERLREVMSDVEISMRGEHGVSPDDAQHSTETCLPCAVREALSPKDKPASPDSS